MAYPIILSAFIKQSAFLYLLETPLYGCFYELSIALQDLPADPSASITVTLHDLLKTPPPEAGSLNGAFARGQSHLIDNLLKLDVFLGEGSLVGSVDPGPRVPGLQEVLAFLFQVPPLSAQPSHWLVNTYLVIKVFSFSTTLVERFPGLGEVFVFNYVSPK